MDRGCVQFFESHIIQPTAPATPIKGGVKFGVRLVRILKTDSCQMLTELCGIPSLRHTPLLIQPLFANLIVRCEQNELWRS